jgi:hypothetical protein
MHNLKYHTLFVDERSGHLDANKHPLPPFHTQIGINYIGSGANWKQKQWTEEERLLNYVDVVKRLDN